MNHAERPIHVMLQGPGGSGKGTVGEVLSRRYGFVEFDGGRASRAWAYGSDGPEQLALRRRLEAGEFTPTPLMVRIYEEWLEAQAEAPRLLTTGYPRGDQADSFIDAVQSGRLTLDGGLWLTAPTEVLSERLAGRRTCPSCEAIYHVVHAPPQTAEVCDRCGEALAVRPEDADPAATRRRMEMYEKRTRPARARMRAAGIPILDVDARGSIEATVQAAVGAIKRLSGRSLLARAGRR